MNKFSIFLLGITASLLAAGCNTLSTSSLLGRVTKPSIESISPRITGLDFLGVDLAFDVDVLNPYEVPIKSPRFKYGLDVEGANFLSSQATANLDLPAKGVGTVVLPVRLQYLDLVQAYSSLKDAAEVPYTLHGALLFSPLGETVELPIRKSGTFPILRIPAISNVVVAPPEVSLGSAKIQVKSNIANPNAFALGLEDLGYALRIGEIELGGLKTSALRSLKAGQSGEISLTGALSGFEAIQQLLAGRGLGAAALRPVGSVSTPYGTVRLPD
jgi:LEA14-like dessication related protein